MKQLNFLITSFLLLFFMYLFPIAVYAQDLSKHIHVTWKSGKEYGVNNQYPLQLIIKNQSQNAIDLKDWNLYFNSIFPIVHSTYSNYSLSDLTGSLFKVDFLHNTVLSSSDSIVIDYQSKYKIANVSCIINGLYFQHAKQPSLVHAVNHFRYIPIKLSLEDQRKFYEELYDNNNTFNQRKTLAVFPSPAYIREREGSILVSKNLKYAIDASFSQDVDPIKSSLIFFDEFDFAEDKDNAQLLISKNDKIAHEGYTLIVSKKGLNIEASSTKGVFYALTSLRSLVDAEELKNKATEYTLPIVDINDKPRFPYRGLMIDISRNFKDKETIKKYIDVMANYKLNKLHLHFIDDEGWRIEIPSLPELTEIGANRSPFYKDGNSLMPAYGSGANSTPDHYLSKKDFIEILKYAKAKFVEVIPEIETPGHARASIKAMEKRYHRFMAMGDVKEAEKYLLHDFEDQSVYSSAQYWTDNVMNVALPSTYTFISTVMDDLKEMYIEAGLNLDWVSIGGDEVPNGAWEKSPKVQELMVNRNFKSVHEVWPYYIEKVYLLAKQKGIQIAGWEEIGMVNDGNGMKVNDRFAYKTMQLDVWNNVIGFGQEDLAYKLANTGYQTVFISASNFYFDMAWNNQFDEPGLIWASLTDLYQSYAFLPEAFFANLNLYAKGKAFDKKHFNKSVRLTNRGRTNLIGLKGGLWNETILDADRLDYMAFPRFFALAERAWSPTRTWESELHFSKKRLDEDYGQFINRIGMQELPKLDRSSIHYRLPAIGIKVLKNQLMANLEYPGFKIYYTTDGSIPTTASTVYNGPIAYDRSVHYTFLVIHENGRTGIPQIY